MNATGTINSVYKIDANFTSNESQVTSNDTTDSAVKITSPTDTTPPTWFDNTTYPSSGVTYSSGQNYQLNITWNDSESSVDTVLIEHNFTGPLDNYTVTTNDGDVYYYDINDLAAGTYVWREYANNTDDYWNFTDQWVYTVEKTKPVLSLNNTTNVVNTSGLVGYWRFESVNSTNYTFDSSGWNNDGRLQNGSTSCYNEHCPNSSSGRFGNAIDFDGIKDHIQIADSDLWDFANKSVTVECVV